MGVIGGGVIGGSGFSGVIAMSGEVAGFSNSTVVAMAGDVTGTASSTVVERRAPTTTVEPTANPTISGTAPTNWVNATTPALPAGTYWIVAVPVVQIAQPTAAAEFTLSFGGTTIQDSLITTGPGLTANERRSKRIEGSYTHPGGTAAVVLQVRRSAGSGNVVCRPGLEIHAWRFA